MQNEKPLSKKTEEAAAQSFAGAPLPKSAHDEILDREMMDRKWIQEMKDRIPD